MTNEPVDDAVDPLMSTSAPELHWTRSNVGEAVPGVMTPLNWSIWGTIGERTTRGGGYALGALSKREAQEPASPQDKVLRVFYGRMAVSVEYMGMLGDRLPGVSGERTVTSLFGRVPEGMQFHPTMRRYPVVAWRLTKNFVTLPRQSRAFDRGFADWWERSTGSSKGLDHAGAVALFREATRRFERAVQLQTNALLVGIQPLYEILLKIAAKAGVSDVSALSGSGHAEIAVVSDIWKASRGEITIEQVIRTHGFHGPQEGEIASHVWREDDTPLHGLIEQYAARPDSEDPSRAETERGRQRERIARQVIDAFPAYQRPVIRFALRLGRTRMPMRGVVKRNFLQALDVARAAARRIGEHFAAEGILEEADDVFYLNTDELLSTVLSPDIKRIVAARRRHWETHQAVIVPGEWTGMPVVTPADSHDASVTTLSGIGVSPGVVEGVARVVTNPDFIDVEPDEILIAPHTDPSWSSIMFISSALVVDIGGALSHAAVVARELGIPCVVNTRTGTKTIQTGDKVRVDGSNGTVEILESSVRMM